MDLDKIFNLRIWQKGKWWTGAVIALFIIISLYKGGDVSWVVEKANHIKDRLITAVQNF